MAPREVPPSDSQQPTIVPALGEGGFEPYLRAIRRHPWVVVAVTLAALAAAGVWMLVRSQRYQATAQVLVTPAPFNDNTYSGLAVLQDTSSDPTRAIETAASMVDSPAAAAATANALGSGWTPGRVASAVTVTPLGGTNVLAVQAVAGQARLAARIANTFVVASLTQRKASLIKAATVLVADLKAAPHPPPATQLDRLLAVSHGSDPTFSVLHLAGGSASATGTAAWRVLSLVLFAGLVLGVGTALLVDLMVRRRAGADVVKLTVHGLPSRKDAPRS